MMNELQTTLILCSPLWPLLLLVPFSWAGGAATGRALLVTAPLPTLVLALTGSPGSDVSFEILQPHPLFVFDGIARVFLAFTAALWTAAGWRCVSMLGGEKNNRRFFICFLLSMSGNFGLILANDLFVFYSAFAVMGLASTGLILHSEKSAAMHAGRVYLVLAMMGEVALFLGLGSLAALAGSSALDAIKAEHFNSWNTLLLVGGFGIKAGALTLHFWLPLAHPAAPAPASAVLSGAMIKAGALGWIRFLPLGDATMPGIGLIMIALGLGGALFGIVVGLTQASPKAVLAYSSVSQMGIVTMALGIVLIRPEMWTATLPSILLYVLHHGLAKGALFMSTEGFGRGPAMWRNALAIIGLIFPALSLAGAPFTSGALAKVALKTNIAAIPATWAPVIVVMMPMLAAGTSLLMIRFVAQVWSKGKAAQTSASASLPWAFLVVATAAGIWVAPGATGWIAEKITPDALWKSTWPLLAGGALALAGNRFRLVVAHKSNDIDSARSNWLYRLDRRFSKLLDTASLPKTEASKSGGSVTNALSNAKRLAGLISNATEQRLNGGPALAMTILAAAACIWIVLTVE